MIKQRGSLLRQSLEGKRNEDHNTARNSVGKLNDGQASKLDKDGNRWRRVASLCVGGHEHKFVWRRLLISEIFIGKFYFCNIKFSFVSACSEPDAVVALDVDFVEHSLFMMTHT